MRDPVSGPDASVASYFFQPVESWLARAVGVAVLVVGLALSCLLAFAFYSAFSKRTAGGASGVVLIAVLVLLATFLVVVGFRLAFSRPNKYKSILSPTVWIFLGLIFSLLTAFIAYSSFYLNAQVEPEIPAFALLFGLGCFGLAQHFKHGNLEKTPQPVRNG